MPLCLTNFGNEALASSSTDLGAVGAVEIYGLGRMVMAYSRAAERP